MCKNCVNIFFSLCKIFAKFLHFSNLHSNFRPREESASVPSVGHFFVLKKWNRAQANIFAVLYVSRALVMNYDRGSSNENSLLRGICILREASLITKVWCHIKKSWFTLKVTVSKNQSKMWHMNSLFRNKRFALNEMFQRNAWKFAIFYA